MIYYKKIQTVIKVSILLIGVFLLSSCTTPQLIKPPDWWYNPHQDDATGMFEKGSAENCANENEARRKAYDNAMALLCKRVVSQVSASSSELDVKSNYALKNTKIFAEDAQCINGKWYAWVLVTYPVKEKDALLDRLEKGNRNLLDIEGRIKQVPHDFNIKIRTADGKMDYYEGESVTFEVKSDKNCYIAVFSHQQDGSTILLFPNAYSTNCQVRAHSIVSIPGTNKTGFQIVVGPPYGSDVVQVIACTKYSEMHKELESLVKKSTSAAYRSIERGFFVQGLNDSFKGFKEDEKDRPLWSEAHLVVNTYERF